VIGWRLFFPIIGHYLHLSHGAYLVLPQIGCLLALALVAGLTYRRLGHWWSTFVVTALFTALPWFFVSCSWLTHFDSWLMIGLIVSAFVRSRTALAVACLLVPWIDERFVLCLPATLAVRAIALAQVQRSAWREILGDLLVVAIASAPYPAIRAVSWLYGDANSTTYVRNHWAELPTVPWYRFLDGMWSGYRVAWVVIAAGLLLAARLIPRQFAILLVLLELVTAVGGLFIAWDMSRSMMMIAPMFVLSMWLWEEWRRSTIATSTDTADAEPVVAEEQVAPQPATPRHANLLGLFLPAVLVANLIVPAYHMLWSTYWPVQTFYTEYGKWRDPPNVFRAVERVHEARRLKEQGRTRDAVAMYDEALRAEGNYPLAYVERAMLRAELGDLSGAERDASEAVQRTPNYPFAFLLRGTLRAMNGERAAAADDLREALRIAPANWEFRDETTRRLAELTQ
jgi:hypothetical protein